MPDLRASVIIPTYNRKASLLDTLHSLARQDFPAALYEIIVVDDGSSDGTASILPQAGLTNLRYIRQDNQGSAAARNQGARASQAKILIFVDDDMLLEAGYVAGLVAEHEAHPNVIGMGICHPKIEQNSSLFSQLFAAEYYSLVYPGQPGEVRFTDCVTNNISIEREPFFKIGEMQDVAGDGPTLWGDIDLGYRARQAGMHFRRSGSAVCYHRDNSFRDLKTYCSRVEHAARLSVRLFRKYPGIRQQIGTMDDKSPLSGGDPPVMVLRKLLRRFLAWQPVLAALEAVTRLFEKYLPIPWLLNRLYRWVSSAYIWRGFHAGLAEYGPLPEAESAAHP